MNDLEFEKIYGWKNRETHRTFLIIDTSLTDVVFEFKKSSKNWIELSDKLKSFFNEMIETDEGRKVIIQIGSLERVDFDQITKHFMEE